MIEFTLRYVGGLADRNLLDAYDASSALLGFQRSLAIATHLALNGEVITHATALQGASILFEAPSEGSFKSRAWVVLGGMITLGSVGKDSPVGHIVTSVYDYVISESLGFHPDYEKTIQQQISEHSAKKQITQEKLDNAVEKSEKAVLAMHRPLYASKTATAGDITAGSDSERQKRVGPELNILTYDYIVDTIRSRDPVLVVGVISSYNIYTFKGRIFSHEHWRSIPFELLPSARSQAAVNSITSSLQRNAANRNDPLAVIGLQAIRLDARNGRLKRLDVVGVEDAGGLL